MVKGLLHHVVDLKYTVLVILDFLDLWLI